MSERAESFARRLDCDWTITLTHRDGNKVAAARRMQLALTRGRPDIVYVFDLAVSGAAAAMWHKIRTGVPFVIDTGDAITALARQSGTRGPLGIAATATLERTALSMAAHVVVRGSAHAAEMARRRLAATVIPDGVDTTMFAPRSRDTARAALGWPATFTITIVGSSIWNPRLQMAYGWDLVELLALLKDLPVRGVLIGDGSGIDRIRAQAEARGVADRLHFAGRQPLSALPDYLAASDVCLSTQSNDLVGQVRTTGKLPLYMACGKYVLASSVGEATRVLPKEMLVSYDGARDDGYPARLAERVRALVTHPDRLDAGLANVDVARREFDYDVLARRVDRVMQDVIVAERGV
jgi:glycosyltransferase involved in cell wall biosynthesis